MSMAKFELQEETPAPGYTSVPYRIDSFLGEYEEPVGWAMIFVGLAIALVGAYFVRGARRRKR